MIKYAFDLDGTVTTVETLPILAAELGLTREIKFLTDLTLRGAIPFDISFRLRYFILKEIPSERIVEIIKKVPLDGAIEKFMREHRSECALVTGNLDRWIEPISARIGCEVHSSTVDAEGRLRVLDKGAVIRRLKKSAERVVAIGESFNDVSMMTAADIAIAYGGVHRPVNEALAAADFVVFDGGTLCRLLSALSMERTVEQRGVSGGASA